MVYTLNGAKLPLAPHPIVSTRPPTSSDLAVPGRIWIDETGNDAYILIEITANEANWNAIGSGSGTFDSVTATTTITAGTDITSTAGTLTLSALATAGVLFNDASGVVSSATGTDGQVIIGATGAAPLWASVVSGDGSMSVTAGANTLDLRVTGAAASTFPTDSGTATPVLGATTVTGGTNIGTVGAGGVVTINVDNAPTFSGLVTAQAGITQSAGTATIVSDTNGAQAIYLHANGGVNETIEVYADQSTNAQSIYAHSDLGGIDVTAGIAAANAVRIYASDAAGGIDIDAGTGGISVVAANGAVNVETGTGALNLGVDAAAHTTTLGSTTTTAATVIQSGTGDVTVTSTDAITLDCAGVLELNSSAGVISIGNDAVTQNINIATGAAARDISIGNGTGATSIDIDAGTGACSILSNATDHTVTFGSTTGVSAMTVQAGTGTMTLTAGGALDANVVGAVTVDGVSFSVDGTTASNVTVTGAGEDLTLGAVGGSVVIDGSEAIVTAVGITASDVAGGITLTSGTAGTVQTTTGAATIDGASFSIDSTTASNVTVTGASEDLSLTAVGGSVVIDGSEAVATAVGITASDAAGGITCTTGTGGFNVSSGGLIDLTPATDSQATPTAASTMNVNIGVATFTGYTTASAGTQTFTITNSLVSTSSGILVTVANQGANDAQLEIRRVTPLAGSFTVALVNSGSQALNGDVTISFMVLN